MEFGYPNILFGVLSIVYGWIWKQDRQWELRIGDTAFGLLLIVSGIANIHQAEDSIAIQILVVAFVLITVVAYWTSANTIEHETSDS